MQISAALAGHVYSKDKAVLAPEGEGMPSFSSVAGAFEERLRQGEATARDAMLGRADPHALVEALASMQSAVDTVAAVRDRVVEAYQEILRMPV